jgi:diguanylate cyclase (GGDEF)-like protein
MQGLCNRWSLVRAKACKLEREKDSAMAGKPTTILLIEDHPGDVRLLQEELAEVQDVSFVLEHARCLADGLTRVVKGGIDAVLLDLSLPDSQGMATFLEAYEHAPHLPIIILSGLDDEELARKAVQKGAQDYLVKGYVNGNFVMRAIQYAIERKWGETQRAHEALRDPLTGLPTRALFADRVGQALEIGLRHQRAGCAVLVLGLDRFKHITTSLGHAAGNQALIAVAQRLERVLQRGDTVARLGEDEFAILLYGTGSPQEAGLVAAQIQQRLGAPFILGGHEVVLTASIGIALSTRESANTEELLRNADIAMYHAKRQGGGRYTVFAHTMRAHAIMRLHIEEGLRRAVERQELRLHYQPIVELPTGKLVGFEALLRWQHPEYGLMSPLQFIPVAEETGLIVPIGAWVLREACRQIQVWQRHYRPTSPLLVSVNVSGRQFALRDLFDDVDQVLSESELAADRLCLEITETVLLDEAAHADTTLRRLRARGVQLWIDDFGSGYSSLSYLHRIPLSVLKIDQSFTSRLDDEGTNAAIVRTILALGQHLRVKVIAEGIETQAQLLRLRDLQCPFGQGYHFYPPLDVASAQTLLAQAS